MKMKIVFHHIGCWMLDVGVCVIILDVEPGNCVHAQTINIRVGHLNKTYIFEKKLKLFTHSMSISVNHNNIKAQTLHLQEVWCTWKLDHGGLWDSSSIKFPINTIWWSVNEYF